MKRVLLMLALGTPCAQTSLAQTQASLGVGVGTVRFPGGTSFSSATFAPALEYGTEARYGSVVGALGAWFTDVSGGVMLERGPVSTTLWAVGRVSDAYGSKGTGSVSLRWFLAPVVSLEVSGGGYLPDPYQDLDRAGYFTASLRVWARGRPSGDAPTRRWPPLVPERRGDSVAVRFGFEGAKAVAIAGDWNAWQPVPLRPLAGDGAGCWQGGC